MDSHEACTGQTHYLTLLLVYYQLLILRNTSLKDYDFLLDFLCYFISVSFKFP